MVIFIKSASGKFAISFLKRPELVSRQIKPLLKVLIFTRHQYEFAASAINSKFSW
jgi:hypothetical protein